MNIEYQSTGVGIGVDVWTVNRNADGSHVAAETDSTRLEPSGMFIESMKQAMRAQRDLTFRNGDLPAEVAAEAVARDVPPGGSGRTGGRHAESGDDRARSVAPRIAGSLHAPRSGRHGVRASEEHVRRLPHLVFRPRFEHRGNARSGSNPPSTLRKESSTWIPGARRPPPPPPSRSPRGRPAPGAARCGCGSSPRTRSRLGARRRQASAVGAIIDVMRSSGVHRWNPSGLRSSSPSMLFMTMPVPGTT